MIPNKSESFQKNGNTRKKGREHLDRLGFMILSILRKNEATNRISSMTIKEIADSEPFGWKENTIFKKLKKFEKSGFINHGLKEGHAHSYFITSKGCEWLEQERKKP